MCKEWHDGPFPTFKVSAPGKKNKSNTTSSQKLSVGAIAGITLGAAVGSIILIAIAVFLRRRRKAKRKALTETQQSLREIAKTPNGLKGSTELSEKVVPQTGELSASERREELPASERRGELDSGQLHELESSRKT
jgi:hypothetical protein